MSYQMPEPLIDGWMEVPELEWLYTQAQRMQTIVEVGSWFGRSTHALCSGCPGTVWAVDHFKGTPNELDSTHAFAKTGDVYARFMEHVGHFPNLKVVREVSHGAARQFEDVDMVFLDADHTRDAVTLDLKCWMPKARKLICGHDIGMEGVSDSLKQFGLKWEKSDSIWYIETNGNPDIPGELRPPIRGKLHANIGDLEIT